MLQVAARPAHNRHQLRTIKVVGLVAYLIVSPLIFYNSVIQVTARSEAPVTLLQPDGSSVTQQTSLDPTPRDDQVTLNQETLPKIDPELSKAFGTVILSLRSRSGLFNANSIYEKITLNKNNQEGQSEYDLDSGVQVTTKYHKAPAISLKANHHDFKQDIVIKNPTIHKASLDLTSNQLISADSFTWDGKEYHVTNQPQSFKAYKGITTLNPDKSSQTQKLNTILGRKLPTVSVPVTKGTTITFATPDGEARYDFGDVAKFNHEVTIQKQGDATVLTLNLKDVAVKPKSSVTLDPTYSIAQGTSYNLRINRSDTDSLTLPQSYDVADINNNGKPDLLIGDFYASHNDRTSSGSVFVIYDDLLANISGTGNAIDLANSANYNVRYDGAQSEGYLGNKVEFVDLNNDGKQDLLIGAPYEDYHSRGGAGSFYIIYNDLIPKSGTGNTFDLTTGSNYNVRYDGAGESRPDASSIGNSLGSFFTIGEIDGNTKPDLFLAAYSAGANYDSLDHERVGVIYELTGDLIATLTGTGNTVDLANHANYNVRYIGDTEFGEFGTGLNYADINGDSIPDLVAGAGEDTHNGRDSAGSLFVIDHNLLTNHPGTGNDVLMASGANYSIRYDGAAASDFTALSNAAVADVNNNGKPDLVIPAGYTNNFQGSDYIIYDSLIDNYNGTGNTVDLATSSNWNIRFDNQDPVAGFGDVVAGDWDGDGKTDLVVNTFGNDPDYLGNLYVFYNDFLSRSGIGNVTPVSVNNSNYSLRYAGEGTNDFFSFQSSGLRDVNNDGRLDLLAAGSHSGGHLNIIYNFPHSISLSSTASTTSDGTYALTGTVSAANSPVAISDVQYSVDTATFAGTWTSCTANDGTFNSTNEAFTCSITLPTAGPHTLRVRAKDANEAYTFAAHYASKSVTYAIAAPTSSSSSSPTTTTQPSSESPAFLPLSLTSIGGGSFSTRTTIFSYRSKAPKPTFAGQSQSGATVTIKGKASNATNSFDLCTATTTNTNAWSCKTSKVLDYGSYTISISAKLGTSTAQLHDFILNVQAPKPGQENTEVGEIAEEASPPVTLNPTVNGSLVAPQQLPYEATLIKNPQGETVLSQFKLALTDSNGQPLRGTIATFRSEPQYVLTDINGVATFKNVAIGKHEVVYREDGNLPTVVPIKISLKPSATQLNVTIKAAAPRKEFSFGDFHIHWSNLVLLYIPALAYLLWLLMAEFNFPNRFRRKIYGE